VADVFGQHDQAGWCDDQNGCGVVHGSLEFGQGKPGCILNGGGVYHTHAQGQDITRNDSDQDRDDLQEAPEYDGSNNTYGQGEHGYQQDIFVGGLSSQQTGLVCGYRG